MEKDSRLSDWAFEQAQVKVRIIQVFNMLETQEFFDWYHGQFSDWITGEIPNSPENSDEIVRKLHSLLSHN